MEGSWSKPAELLLHSYGMKFPVFIWVFSISEMAVCGRYQWEAQTSQMQRDGQPWAFKQQQRALQPHAQVLQQE